MMIAGPARDDVLAERRRCIVECFYTITTPLYVIVDSAHDHRGITSFVGKNPLNYCALFGKQLVEITDGRGPYLAALSVGDGFLESLIDKAWGKSWCIFLTGTVDLPTLRRHLARLVSVKIDEGNVALFRFYDPRVLRHYLPTCLPDELNRFFGPITSFYTESGNGENLIRFSLDYPCLEVNYIFGSR